MAIKQPLMRKTSQANCVFNCCVRCQLRWTTKKKISTCTRHVIAQRTREDGKSSCPRCTAYVHISCSHSMDVLQAKSNFLGYSTQQYNLINICKSKSPWWCHCLINIPLTTRYNPALASVPRQQVQTIIIIATGLFWPARTLIHKLNHVHVDHKGESMWLCKQ